MAFSFIFFLLCSEIEHLECLNKSRVPDFVGKESNSSRTVIIVVVTTIAFAVVIISISIFIYLRARNPVDKVESKSEIGLPFLFAK